MYSTGVMVYYVTYRCNSYEFVQYWCFGSLRHFSLFWLKGVYSTGVMVYCITYLCHHLKVCTVLVSWFTISTNYSTGVMVKYVTYLFPL